jgi:hypothetical protein
MVRELGVDAAEARIKEAAQVIAPKTDTVNKTEIRFFIRKSLVLEHEFALIAYGDALCRASGRSVQRASDCQMRGARSADRISEVGEPTFMPLTANQGGARQTSHARAQTFATSLAIKKVVSAPRVIASCLVRAHDRRKSGSPQRVARRGP